MKTRYLSKREIKNIIRELNVEIPVKDLLGLKETLYEGIRIYHIGQLPLFFREGNKIYPTIFFLNKYQIEIPYVIVDKGAVAYILKGANVMRPGILRFSKFMEGETVAILDEDKKILGVGVALISSEIALSMKKGKVIKTVHYYGDKICKLSKKLK